MVGSGWTVGGHWHSYIHHDGGIEAAGLPWLTTASSGGCTTSQNT
jgi:hypothetical protein